MGYFPNGTAGIDFQEEWCSKCAHNDRKNDTVGCAVWDAHLLFSYELVNKKKDPGKVILDMLIDDGCTMFISSSRLDRTKRLAHLNAIEARTKEMWAEMKSGKLRVE